jgi:hypothetical protein
VGHMYHIFSFKTFSAYACGYLCLNNMFINVSQADVAFLELERVCLLSPEGLLAHFSKWERLEVAIPGANPATFEFTTTTPAL